ncbi:MAG: hypothetical protein VKJ04_00395 [Vampirovibrionales bacterium]|nr:hypothetical protein [Vampirovibrionales bacterium]
MSLFAMSLCQIKPRAFLAFFFAGALISVYVSGVALAQGKFGAPAGNIVQSPKAQESQGIHHVLDVLGGTNVYRVDRQTSRSFQEFFEQKNTITNENNAKAAISSRGASNKSSHGIQAPKKLDTRAF